MRESTLVISGIHPASGASGKVSPQQTGDTIIQALKHVDVTVNSSVSESDGVLAWLSLLVQLSSRQRRLRFFLAAVCAFKVSHCCRALRRSREKIRKVSLIFVKSYHRSFVEC